MVTLGNVAVRDPDPKRALETARLIRSLAPHLGISGRVDVRLDGDADRRLVARQTAGLVESGQVLLRPGGFDPGSTGGRYLLGHELTHAAQVDRGNGAPPRRLEEAEAEARQVGAAIALGRPFLRPLVAAPSTSSLRLELEAEIRNLEALAASHEKEKAYIGKQLHGWWVSDSDVNRALETLQAVPFFVGVGIVQSLESGERYDLVNNINDNHYKRFRPQILECYGALGTEQFERFDEDLLKDLDLYELTPEEHWAVRLTYNHLPKKAQAKLMRSKNALPLSQILQAEPGFDEKRLRELHKQAEEEEAAIAKRGEEQSKYAKQLKPIREDVRKLLNHPNRENILTALDHLSPMLRALPELAALAHELDEDESLDKLVEKAPLDAIFKLHSEDDEKKKGTDLERQRQDDWLSVSRRQVFVFLAAQRPAYKNVALVEELTHGWFFDWNNPLNEQEAQFTFELIKAAPPAMRKSFQNYQEGKYWKRVQDTLPPSVRMAPSTNLYGGGANQLDRAALTSALLDAGLWTPDRMDELDGRIRMAVAAGEGQFVFDLSRQREIFKTQPKLLPLIEKYRLYNPKAVMPDGSLGRTQYQPEVHVKDTVGFWSKLGPALRAIGKIDYSNDTLHGEDIDGLDLQKLMGGTLQGIQLKEHPDVAYVPSVQPGEPGKPINHVDRLALNMKTGDLLLQISGLAIDRVNYLQGDMAVQGADGMLTGLSVIAKYQASDEIKVSYLKLDVGSVTLSDVTLALGESIYAINKVELRGVHYFAGSDTASPDELQPQKVVLGPFYGFELYGLLRAYFGHKDSILAALATTRKISASVESFKLTGVTTSSGRYVKSIDGRGLSLRSGAARDQYKWALEEAKKAFPGRIADARARQSQAADPKEIERYAAAIRQLERQQLSVEAALASLERESDNRGGVDLDVDQLNVNTATGDLKLMALHAHGRVSQFKEGDPGRPVLLSRNADADISISLGEVSFGNVGIPKSPPSRKVMKARIDRLDRKIAERKEKGLPYADRQAAREELRQQLSDLTEYEDLAARGIPNLSAQEQQKFIALRDRINNQAAGHIGEISVEGGTLDLGFGGTQTDGLSALLDLRNLNNLALSADRVELKHVALPGQGVEIDRIEALKPTAAYVRGEGGWASAQGVRILAEGVHLVRTEAALRKQAEKYQTVLKTGGALSEGEQKKLAKITEALDGLREIQAGLDTAYDRLRFARNLREQSDAEDRIRSLERELQAWSDSLSIGKISFENPDFSIGGLGDILDPDEELYRGSDTDVQSVQGGFTGVTVQDVNAGNTRIKNIAGGKGGAAARVQEDRIDLDDFRIESLEVSGVRYSGGSRSVATEGTATITGVSLKGSILFDQVLKGQDQKERVFTVLRIDDFLIRKIEAPKIVYRQPVDGEVLTLTIGPGALEVLHLENFEIRIAESDDSFSFSGAAGLNAIQALKLRAELGKRLSVSTTLNASTLTAEFATDGIWRANIGSLSLEDGEFKSPSANVKFSLTKLKAGAKFDPQKNAVSIDIPEIERIKLASLSWRDGTNQLIADRPVTLHKTYLKADLYLDSKGDIDRVAVSSLVVPTIDAEHIYFTDGEGLVVEIKKLPGKPDERDDSKALQIRNIRLTGLAYNFKTRKTSLGSLKTSEIAAQIAVSLTEAGKKELDLSGKINAKSLEVDFVKEGKPVADLKGLSGSIGGNVYGAAFNVKLDNLDANAVVDKNKIGIRKLTISSITLDSLHYKSPKFTLSMTDKGSVLLETISAAIDIELNPPPKPGEEPPSRVKSVKILELKVDKITAAGIAIGLPSLGDLQILLPEDPKGVINNVRIEKPKDGDQPFTIERSLNKKTGKKEWGALGAFAADKADIAGLGLSITDKLKLTTHATAETIGLSFTPEGGPEVNIETTTLDEIQGQAGPGKFVVTKGVQGASKAVVKNLKYAGGKLTTKRVEVQNLVYDIEAKAASTTSPARSSVRLEIAKAEVPVGQEGFAVSIDPDKEVVIPELRITNAHLVIGNVMELGDGKASPAGAIPWNLSDFKFTDALDGHVRAVVNFDKWYMPKQIPVDFGIRNGVISLDEIEASLPKSNFQFEPHDDYIALRVDLPVIPRFEMLKMPYEDKEDRELGAKKQVKVSHLVAALAPIVKVLLAMPSSAGPPFVTDITDVHASLSTTKLAAIDFGRRGRIRLGSGGKMGIVTLRADSGSLKAHPLAIGLDEVNVAVEDLVLGDFGEKGVLNIGQIHVGKVDPVNTTLKFEPGPKPSRLEGTVTEAFAKKIHVRLKGEEKK